jgi:hypothetical protein
MHHCTRNVAKLYNFSAADSRPPYGGSCSHCQVRYLVPVPAALKFLSFLKGTCFLQLPSEDLVEFEFDLQVPTVPKLINVICLLLFGWHRAEFLNSYS